MTENVKAAEVAPAVVREDGVPVARPAAVSPTQMRYPWKSTARTAFQMSVAFATLVPFLIFGVYGSSSDYPAVVAQVLVVAGAVTRVMALPQVELFLRRFAPFLSAAPKPDTRF